MAGQSFFDEIWQSPEVQNMVQSIGSRYQNVAGTPPPENISPLRAGFDSSPLAEGFKNSMVESNQFNAESPLRAAIKDSMIESGPLETNSPLQSGMKESLPEQHIFGEKTRRRRKNTFR